MKKSESRNNNHELKEINLELRMAATLRFMACVSISMLGGEGVNNAAVREAIGYHDEAVSLLVGVFDDEKEDATRDMTGNTSVGLSPLEKYADGLNTDDSTNGDSNEGVLLLTVPTNPHIRGPTNTKSIQLSFLHPTENQRVRAISSSLNTLASLHASLQDSRSAMDSYREALEILKAATEECSFSEEEKEELSIECDLAGTLMNVGNFHLRRDELEAARNAFGTVFALNMGDNNEKDVLLPKLNDSPQIYSLQALEALNNLGIVHERKGELDKAWECYHQVRLSRVQLLGESSIEVADAWVNIGNCSQRKLEWEDAEAAYLKAGQIYRQRINDCGEGGGVAVRIRRALSGALRNNATCCWKQRRISDAIDQFRDAVTVEEKVVCLLSEGIASMGERNDIQQAKLSMAQLLGILGCLYLEHSSVELRSFKKSKAAFQRAIQIYFELGYDASHPSIVWAGNNLQAVGVMEEKSKVVPPPPPPTPPPKKRGASPFCARDTKPDAVNRASSAGKEEADSVFLGVEDYQSSMDELDEILSERVENVTKAAEEVKLLDDSGASPFDGKT